MHLVTWFWLFILFQFREVAFSRKHLRWNGEGGTAGEWEGQPGGVRGRGPHQVQRGRLFYRSIWKPAGHHSFWSHRPLLGYAWLNMTSISIILYNKLCRFLYLYIYIYKDIYIYSHVNIGSLPFSLVVSGCFICLIWARCVWLFYMLTSSTGV